MKRKCTDYLMEEHKTILRAIYVLDAIAAHAAEGPQPDKEDVDGILDFLRLFGDEFHQGKEEKVLFPVFTAVCDRSEIEAVRHMLVEHDQDRSLIEGMRKAMEKQDAAGFARQATRLAEMLRTHIYKEDNILFELVNRCLSDGDDQRVLAEFESFDREFKSNGLERLLHRLRMLEWKYLHKAA